MTETPTTSSCVDTEQTEARKRVNIRPLKDFAFQKLPDGLLRDDILSRPDEIGAEEYLADVRVWLRLLRQRR